MHPFSRNAAESVVSLGEEKLLAAVQRWLGAVSPRRPFGIGDDCAVLPSTAHRQLITVDPVVYPRHFNDAVPPRAVGAKLLKRNLSDLAAMGGKPSAAVLALCLDAHTSLTWLEAFYRGLASCARRYSVDIVGGDIVQADGMLAATLTLLGTATGPRILTRQGARIGDSIYVTGRLGGSLGHGHHHRFIPRLREGAWLARRPEVRAMMDISDGLAKDVHALTPARSHPVIEAATLPLRRGCTIEEALSDGEDYELLFALDREADQSRFTRAWRRAFPAVRLTRIGQFVHRSAQASNGIDLSSYHGYEHLR